MERPDNRTIWNKASVTGLVLGLICIAYMLLSLFTVLPGGMITTFLNFALWLCKFIGCIAVMRLSMMKFAAANPGASNADTRKLGIFSALLSAIIVAGFNLVSILFITPEAMQETVNAVLSQYAGMLDTNTMNSVEQMMGKLPAITFFSNLIYCFLYGTVLSAILSSNIPSKNPFDRIDGAQTTDNQ